MQKYFPEEIKLSNVDINVSYKDQNFKNISYYNQLKRRLSFYDMSQKITQYYDTRKDFIKNVVDNDDFLKKSLKNKFFQYNKTFTSNEYSEYDNEILKNKIEIDNEFEKIKKQGMNNTLSETVVSTVKSSVVRLNVSINPEAVLRYKNFIKHKRESLKHINLETLKILKEDLQVKEFFEFTKNDYKNIVKGSDKDNLSEFHTTMLKIKHDLKNRNICNIAKHEFNQCCFYFSEFIFYAYSIASIVGTYKYRYYTGQPEHQKYFNNLMQRMIWFFRYVEKRQQFSKIDIIDFMDLYIFEEETFQHILDNLDTYLEYNKKAAFYFDVLTSLTYVIYKKYLELAYQNDYLLPLSELQQLSMNQVIKYLDETKI